MTNAVILSDLEQALSALREGAITADAIRQLFEQAVVGEQDLVAEIDKTYTMADLKKRLNFPHGNKKQQANQYLRALLSAFIVADSYSFNFNESPFDGMRRALAKQTDEQIAAYAASRRERTQALVKAVTDPVTLEEFGIFLRHRPESDLTDEQLALYDTLAADDALRRAQEDAARRAVVAKVEAPVGLALIVKESWHDKRQCAVWLVQPDIRVGREVFDNLSATARRFGGRWSNWGPVENHGFLFFNQSDAEAFANITESDGDVIERWERREEERRRNTAERFADMADDRQEQAEAAAGADRKINTARRARMAEDAVMQAEAQAHQAGILASVADALTGGRLRYLARLRHATDIDTLETVLAQAKYAAIRKQYPQGDPRIDWRRPVTLGDVRFTEYPWPRFERSRIRALLAAAARRRNLGKHTYSLKVAAGITGTVRTPAQPGEHEREFVTISDATFDDLVALLSALPDFDDGSGLRLRTLNAMRLRRMGIGKLPHLRAALREYLPFRPERPVLADRIKLMEWDLAGRTIPGYFPTPQAVVERLIDAATLPEWTAFILEPSAGKGNIAEVLRENHPQHIIDCIEPNTDLRRILEAKGLKLVGYDFMSYELPRSSTGEPMMDPYDRILMNPPFEDGQDMAHVRRAYELLRRPDKYQSGGRLVAITSRHWTFANDKAAVAFREWVNSLNGQYEDLPDGSFKSSERPTGVATAMLILDRR